MTSPHGMNHLWTAVSSTAHDGIFWRYSTHGVDDVKTVNVAVSLQSVDSTPVTYHDGSYYCCSGVVMEPSLPEIKMTPKHSEHIMTTYPVQIFIPQDMLCLRDTMSKVLNTKDVVCMIAVKVSWKDGTMQIHFHEQCSGVAFWPRAFQATEVQCAELFCGGFAGWDYAVGFLRSLGVKIQTVVAVDASVEATHMYASNHNGVCMDAFHDPRTSQYRCKKDEVLVLSMPVQMPTWYHVLYARDAQVWCISPPCPPFSRASDMMGFLRNDGKVTLEAICTIRLNQPCMVCLENVPGMSEGDNLRVMRAMFKWAGYHLLHHECNDLGDVAPTSRKRWLSIWIRDDFKQWALPVNTSWFRVRDFSISDFGIQNLQMSLEILADFLLSDDQIQMYGDAAFLPTSMRRNKTQNDAMSGCRARCVPGSAKFGTFVASYGSQHELPRDALLDKGMFAQLMISEKDGIRFITPFEQALALVTPLPIMIPSDKHAAYTAFGNAISPPQALYCLTKALQSLSVDHVPAMDAMLMVIQYVSKRPNPADVQIIKMEQTYLMVEGDELPVDMMNHDTCLQVGVPHETLDDRQDHQENPVRPHDSLQNDVNPTHDEIEEPGPKRVCRPTMVDTVSPTEHFEVDSNCGGPPEMDDEAPPQYYATVTILLPHDALVGRYPVPVTAREILSQRGYDPSRMMLKTIQGRGDVMDFIILQDTTLVSITDCRDHIEHAAHIFAGTADLHFGPQGDQPKVTVVIKWSSGSDQVVFWRGILGFNTPLLTIHKAVTAELRRVGVHADLRWTNRASAISHDWGWLLKDISSAGLVKLHFHLPISGGGPKETRMDENMRTQLAAELVNAGVGFSQLVPMVTMIGASANVTQIQQAMQITEQASRQKAVLDLASKAGVSVDSKHTKRTKAAAKIQKTLRAKKAQGQGEIDVMTLTIDANVFQNADDTAAQVTTGAFEPNGTGVYLTTLESALPWLQSTSTFSADEFSILLLGNVNIDTKLPRKFVQFRARQQTGGMLLLRGTLFQLGTKEITLVEGTVTNIACPSTSVVTFTAYADEFSTLVWTDLTASPGKHMLDCFDPDTRRQAVLGIWGHSFQFKGKPAKPNDCDSVQIHARVLTGSLPALLKQSGWNSVYMVPKQDDRDRSAMPDSQYSVIWTGQPKQETMISAKEIQATLGLVRNRNSIGIRVAAASYETAWKKVHPQKDVPTSVKVQMMYKAQNMPCNMTVVELRQWLTSINWQAKPLKKLSHATWLIGANAAPSQSTYVLNDHAILLTALEKRVNVETPILAGRPSTLKRPIEVESKQEGQVVDAWAAWKLKHPGQTAFQQQPVSAAPPRAVEGPVTTRLSEQDAKFEQLARDFETMKAEVQADKKEVRQALQNQSDQLAQFSQAVDQRFQANATENTNRFGSLQMAVDAGRQAQDEQFKIIRDMLMSANLAGSRKTSKTDGTTTPGGKDDDKTTN